MEKAAWTRKRDDEGGTTLRVGNGKCRIDSLKVGK